MNKLLFLTFLFYITSIASSENYDSNNFNKIAKTIKNNLTFDVNKVKNLPKELLLHIESYFNNFRIGFEPYAVFNTNTDICSSKLVLANTWLVYTNSKGLEIFDLIENKVIKKIDEFLVRSIDYDPTNNVIAYSSYASIILYDCNTGQEIIRKNLGKEYASAIKFSKDYQFLYCAISTRGRKSNKIQMYDLNMHEKHPECRYDNQKKLSYHFLVLIILAV